MCVFLRLEIVRNDNYDCKTGPECNENNKTIILYVTQLFEAIDKINSTDADRILSKWVHKHGKYWSVKRNNNGNQWSATKPIVTINP